MGITVAYRGRLADLARVEDFEDRLIDFALEVGGLGQIWRSFRDDEPGRMIRGVILNLAPGLEPVSLLLSPQGWLIGLAEIEDAERGRLTEPPWCFTKTQFGPLEGHVALIEMLAALKREFLPDLEVSDEGGYWDTRDLDELARRRALVQAAIDGLGEGLERHGLSREAAEDPEILIKRIERIAAHVHRILHRPAEHPPLTFPDDYEVTGRADPEAAEALWDEMFKHNRRRQEQMQRAIEERRARGETDDEAFDHSLEDVGIVVPDEETDSEEEPWDAAADSLPEPEPDDDAWKAGLSQVGDEGDPFPDEDDRHPLLKCAMDLLIDLRTVFRGADPRYAASLNTLYQGAGDAMGGLAQALPSRDDDEDDDELDNYGLQITQLKRALRGAAFARGALFSLRPAMTPEKYQELHHTLKQFEHDIFHEISRLRSERQPDDG